MGKPSVTFDGTQAVSTGFFLHDTGEGNSFIRGTVIGNEVCCMTVAFHFYMGEDLFHFQFSTGDGCGSAVYGNICHFDDQNLLFPIGIGKNIAGLQACDVAVGISNDICSGFVICTDDRIYTLCVLQHLSGFCINSKVGGFVVIQIQNSVCIIVIGGGGKQLLHFSCVHWCIVRCAQGRVIICVQQVG